jgi:hypothetical protein
MSGDTNGGATEQPNPRSDIALGVSASPRLRDRAGLATLLRLWVCFLLLLVGVATGCRPSEPLTVETIQTGKSLNSDNSIGTHSASFRPKETMYVAVLTTARGSGTITVRWKLGGQVIHEVTREVSYNDQAATDFRFEAADGFPVGTYTIEVLLDGKPVGERTVRVE